MNLFAFAIVAFAGLAACNNSPEPVRHASNALVMVEDGVRLSTPRATHALVRIADGRLLAIGGCVAQGCESGPGSSTLDIISPDGRKLLGSARLTQPRVQPSAIALSGGRALIIGGWVNGQVSGTTEIFDAATGQSRPGPALSVGRASPVLVKLDDGRILIAGGNSGGDALNSAEIFSEATGKMERAGDLMVARTGSTGTLLPNGKVLIVGGGSSEADDDRRALASAELFDPSNNRFALTGNLDQRRYKHGAVALPSGDVLVIGGSDERDYSGKLRSVERYDVASGTFRAAGNLTTARFKLADGVILMRPNKILIAAGHEFPEVYDVQSQKSSLLPDGLDGQWNYMTASAAADGGIFLVGGYREGRIEPTDRSWIFSFPSKQAMIGNMKRNAGTGL